MPNGSASQPLARNRFARHPKTTIVVTIAIVLAAVELASYLVILAKRHGDLRFQYRYNRILSGYTVFQNVPRHSFRTSAIKTHPEEPDPVLDEQGFLSDAPVSLDKPAGLFRIFLVGGSTAFGAGQNVRYHSVRLYPDGVYSYPSSIAGHLKVMLERGHPGMRFEVVNAAGFERRIHQSFIQYVQTLSRYRPDLIINLDGMNDVYSLVSGTPFDDVEQQLPFYVELYSRPHSLLNYSATYYVLSTAYEKWVNRRRDAEPGPSESSHSAVVAPPGEKDRVRGEPGRDAYEAAKPRYQHNADRVLQILRQYFAVLKTDGTRCVFVLQPLLHRTKLNKQLSETEKKFLTVMVPAGADAKTRIDENALLLSYFYDEVLSPAIRETAAAFQRRIHRHERGDRRTGIRCRALHRLLPLDA